jgi:hypothetical protein
MSSITACVLDHKAIAMTDMMRKTHPAIHELLKILVKIPRKLVIIAMYWRNKKALALNCGSTFDVWIL